MTKKPIIYNIIPFLLICIAASFYFQVAYLLDLDLSLFYQISSHITLPNWMTICLLIASAVSLYQGHFAAKWLMPLTVLMVFWNNYLVAVYANNFSSTQTIIGSALFPCLFAPFYTQKNRRILADRRSHWWETSPRKPHKAYAAINPFVGSSFNSTTFDISKSGAFVEVDELNWNQLPKVGERVNLNITLDTLRKVRCEAMIVRLEEPKGNYPRGLGLRFTALSDKDRKTLNTFLDH